MQTRIDDQTVLRAPALVVERAAGAALAVDPASPNWIATDDRGLRILRYLDGRTPLRDVIRSYAADADIDLARASLHVDTFVRDGLRQRFISTDGAVPLPYLGRAAYLRTDRLREFWIQVNDFCNLACEHCLVSSGPDHTQGLPGAAVQAAVDQAVALGVERFYLTGGEPLARPDAVQLIEHIVGTHARELVVMTNGPDEPAVFREIWRVLRDGGRAVIADIVADGEVPPPMRADGQLWGECISGALSEDGFLAAFERAGFYGISVLKKTFWREVEGTRFYSVTVRGYKFEKRAGCRYIGQYGIYLGPMKNVTDEEGHVFPRGVPVEICTDTAAKLAAAPYATSFAVVDGPAATAGFSSDADCGGGDGSCC